MKVLALTAVLALGLSACTAAPPSADLSTGTPTRVSAQTAPALTGGTDLLGSDAFAAFSVPQVPEVRTETVAVTGQSFTGDYLLTATLGQKTVSLPVTLNRASGEFTLRLP